MRTINHILSNIEADIFTINKRLKSQGETIMSALSDLQDAVAAIKGDVSDVGKAISDLVAAVGSNDDAGVEAAVADLQAAHSALQASVASAAPPAPAPEEVPPA
jgi:predicted trehalose synthase